VSRTMIRRQIAELQAKLRGGVGGVGRPPYGRDRAALFILAFGPATTKSVGENCGIASAYKTLAWHSEWFKRTASGRWSLTDYGRKQAEILRAQREEESAHRCDLKE